jgi:hypothetical protein
LVFEAALATGRTCFQLDAEGHATLVLQVPAEAAPVLALAMAKQQLNERTFTVRIEL